MFANTSPLQNEKTRIDPKEHKHKAMKGVSFPRNSFKNHGYYYNLFLILH